MAGYFSLMLRKRRARKEKHETTARYADWKQELDTLPAPQVKERQVLLVRLDDIGDYILFRNCLDTYRRYFSKKGYKIHFLGNDAWRPIFEQYDTIGIQPLWLDKKRYSQDASYRLFTWKTLRGKGFEIVICPSRTRPLLLDDLCMLACAPIRSFAAANTQPHAAWNNISDSVYTDISALSSMPGHEFIFNARFAEHICKASPIAAPVLHLEAAKRPAQGKPYLVCFVGASAKSKLWPAARWIRFIQLTQSCFKGDIFIAGGPADKKMADDISNATNSISVAGTKSLTEMIDLIAYATVTISNDTMAAHIGAASGVDTIIITTGNNGHRFTDYRKTGKNNIITIYSPRYQKLLKKGDTDAIYAFQGITSDIAAIKEQTVFAALQKFIGY